MDKRNTYKYQFSCGCPNNDRDVIYSLVIEHDEMIMVEDIITATRGRNSFHETLADFLHEKFGGKQTMIAHHHGVDVETIRG